MLRVGIEHEFRVERYGRQVDFREVIHTLDIPGGRLDPGDPNAYRLPAGISVTCDGEEAEVASPPIDVEPGFTTQASAWMRAAKETLDELVGDSFQLTGVSTHISVSCPEEHAVKAAGMFCRTFAPAQMLMMDDRDSPGLLVRPRFGRVELGGEFVTGPDLEAAVAMATGGVLICSQVASRQRRKRSLAPPIRVEIVPSVQRYGWYIDREAFGIDLYEAGREAALRRELVGSITVQKLLDSAWAKAKQALGNRASVHDLNAADRRISGDDPLPSERSPGPHAAGGPVGQPVTKHNWLVETLERPGFSVEPIAVSWDFTVVKITGLRDAYISVPARDAGQFVDELMEGALDTEIERLLEAEPNGSTLAGYEQACLRGVYDEIASLDVLAPPERGHGGPLTTT